MTSKILHGRRKGDIKENKSGNAIQKNLQEVPKVNMNEVTILSQADWDRIQKQLNRREMEKKEREKIHQDREDMINKSKNLVQYWTNTIAGQRLRRLEARKLREQKDEEEKQAVDLEEAKYQAQKRKEAIDKAKTQLYFQTDRVKTFHTALRLTEAMKEREAQVELKKLRSTEQMKRDQEWVELEKHQCDEYYKREHEKLMNIRQRNFDNAAFVKAQCLAQQRQRDDDTEASFQEGRELRRLAQEFKEEQEILTKMNLEEMKQLKAENDKQLADQKRLQEIAAKQQEEEDNECRIFASAKRKILRMRRDKEREMQNERMKRLEEISEKLASQMKTKSDDELMRINTALAEREAALNQAQQEKDELLKKRIEEIEKHRLQQFKEHEDARQQYVEDQLAERRKNEEADRIFRNNEEYKVKRRMENNKEISDYILKQDSDHRQKKRDMKALEIALDEKKMEQFLKEEEQFQEYAGIIIDNSRKSGRNVQPLEKCRQEGIYGWAKPSSEVKGVVERKGTELSSEQLPPLKAADTKSKLGFVW